MRNGAAEDPICAPGPLKTRQSKCLHTDFEGTKSLGSHGARSALCSMILKALTQEQPCRLIYDVVFSL